MTRTSGDGSAACGNTNGPGGLRPCSCKQDWTLTRFFPGASYPVLLWVLPQSPPNEAASQEDPRVSLCFSALGLRVWGDPWPLMRQILPRKPGV